MLMEWEIIQNIPLIFLKVLPLLAEGYGGFLIIKKAFRLAKQFENAE